MKKLFLIATIIITIFTSCEDRDPNFCECGLIVEEDVNYYSFTIRNECTEEVEEFYFERDVWAVYNVGDDFCLTN